MNASVRRTSLAALAVVLVAPAAAFFLSAIGRSLQPTSHEPSRTLDAIVTWFTALPDAVVVIVLLILPILGLALAAGLLWRAWRNDGAVRSDTIALAIAMGRFSRRIPIVLAVLVIVFGLVYFAAITVHAIAG